MSAKWKQLHQNYTGDAPCRVDPEVGVAEAGPGDASCARAAQPDVLRFYLGDHGMPKQVVLIAGTATPPSAFKHVVRAGDFLFVSSQLSVDLATHTLLPGDTASQTRQAIENLKLLLEGCGASLEDVVKTTVYMRDVAEFSVMNHVYGEYFQKGTAPTRGTIQAASPLPGINVEIDAVAHSPTG
jgi:2-iminobutanoate/2-iminopropanoate deaminase